MRYPRIAASGRERQEHSIDGREDRLIRRSSRTGLPLIPKSPPAPSTRCADLPPAELLAGIDKFNAGEYWRCHETLEALWRGEADPIRSLYQGILLIGVGYYHRQRGNTRGALIKLRQGVTCLEPFRPTCMRLDIEGLVGAALHAITVINNGKEPDASGPYQIRLTQ